MSYQPPIKKINRHHHPRLSNQRGVVLVVALFIVALVAAMSYVMMARLDRDTNRTRLILHDTQAELYAQGSIDWAKDQLRNDWENQQANRVIDTLPMKAPVKEMNGYKITSTIYDMQARFNVNNLTNTEMQNSFKRLLQLVAPTLTDENRQALVMAATDWVTPTSQQQSLEKYYFSATPPYRAAHRMMVSVDELRLVKGMTPALFDALRPYVTALPAVTPVNVQTASAPVLATLGETMTLETGQAIEVIRSKTPLVSVEAFESLDVIKNHPVSKDKITVTSAYFLVETVVAIEEQKVVLYTLLERVSKEKQAVINILWQSKGAW